MFPEAFAERWIDRLTRPGDTVLDPFCGRGTVPFQAVLMNRRAIGVDVNPVAYCISAAKTNSPSLVDAETRLMELKAEYDQLCVRPGTDQLPEFFAHAFHPDTLAELAYLRGALDWRSDSVDCMLAAIVLGILHGESQRSQSYLSNQMPRTISTKPAYSVRFWTSRGLVAPRRNVFENVGRQLIYRYASSAPELRASVYMADMREMPRLLRRVAVPLRCVITSPPYLDVTNFEEDQWLRLWFLGGPPRPTKGRISRDDRHESLDSYWRLIADMWRALGQVLSRRSHVVIRIGAKGHDPERLATATAAAAMPSRRRVRLVEWEVSQIRRRQTGAFRPGSEGCVYEVDCLFAVV